MTWASKVSSSEEKFTLLTSKSIYKKERVISFTKELMKGSVQWIEKERSPRRSQKEKEQCYNCVSL